MSDLRLTSSRLRDLELTRATLLVDGRRLRANIHRFTARARASNVTLRPHFKTHQSADVGKLFREVGVTRATVSSLGQASYFADHGWDDLTLAMGANPLEVAEYSTLAARVRLGLLADSMATVDALAAGLTQPARLWLDVDVEDGRTGIRWDDTERLVALARRATAAGNLELAGLLACRDALAAAGVGPLAVSAGDTPGFAVTASWAGLDEARPGNFVFFDLMQLAIGACTADDLACAVACPVVGVYPDRNQVVVHAGAVHLSRESLNQADGAGYGRLMTLEAEGFGTLVEGWSVVSLSQEHGVLNAGDEVARATLGTLKPGDLLLIAPVHSCLTCEQFSSYRMLDGTVLGRYRRG